QSGSAGLVDGNTIDQPTGDDLKVDTSASTLTVRNNIFTVRGGFAENIANDSQVGYTADYNFFDIGGTGVLGKWGSASFTSRAEWFFKLGLDGHGRSGDPQYTNAPGPDGVLGFSTATIGVATFIDDGEPGYSQTGPWTTV